MLCQLCIEVVGHKSKTEMYVHIQRCYVSYFFSKLLRCKKEIWVLFLKVVCDLGDSEIKERK